MKVGPILSGQTSYTENTREAQETTLYVTIHTYTEAFQLESVVSILLWNSSTYPEYPKCLRPFAQNNSVKAGQTPGTA